MIAKLTASRLGFLLSGAAAFLATTLLAARAEQQPVGASQVQAPPAAPGGAPQTPDFKKQIEDALKEIEKLDKAVPDDVRPKIKPGNFRPVPMRSIGTAYTIGLRLHPPLPTLIEQLKLPPDQGLMVADVRSDTYAAKSGFQKFDVLMQLNGKPVSRDVTTFNNELREYKQGADLAFSVLRRGKLETIKGFQEPGAAVPPAPVQPQIAPGAAPSVPKS